MRNKIIVPNLWVSTRGEVNSESPFRIGAELRYYIDSNDWRSIRTRACADGELVKIDRNMRKITLELLIKGALV